MYQWIFKQTSTIKPQFLTWQGTLPSAERDKEGEGYNLDKSCRVNGLSMCNNVML